MSEDATRSFRVNQLAQHPLMDEGRFLPGVVLNERYRIVARLGKGGMGEVYRANDLNLGVPVALKFLLESAAGNQAALTRLRQEVRMAREVTHLNVCRVFDLGETGGQHFISMEYVDGEDLSSLLRRIGRLPPNKAVDMARQLCAGISAAHARGVLHRDLKPANIMVDGRGQIVVMDFGLAAPGLQLQGPEAQSGTPAYMAPEQLAGREASVQSDIYALGLVLYEIFTGKPAFQSGTLAEMLQVRSTSAPISLSSLVADVDPAVERVILRCLQADPKNRPPSVAAVAAGLPGGDPLAAAVAAGDTPSPNMVAAAGLTEGIPLKVAAVWLVAAVASLLLLAVVQSRTSLISKLPLEYPPQVLATKGREIAQRLGYPKKPADKAYGFAVANEALSFTAGKGRDLMLATGKPVSPIFFWYRESPRPLVPLSKWDVTAGDPPADLEGAVIMELSPAGTLQRLRANPEPDSPATATGLVSLLAVMGLDPARFTSVPPRRTPAVAFDARMAWDGSYAEFPNATVHVEGASLRDRVVDVEMTGPWSKAAGDSARSGINEGGFALGLGLVVVVIVIGATWARRNLRKGRGDRVGAFGLASVVFAARMGEWLLSAHHVLGPSEFLMAGEAASWSLLIATIVWFFYIAMEPYLRQRWPHGMISWTRVLRKSVRDPLVGRDLLVGVAFAGIGALIICARNYFMLRSGAPLNRFILGMDVLDGAQHVISTLLSSWIGLFIAFFYVLVLVFLAAVCRRFWLACAAFVVINLLFSLITTPPAVGLPISLLRACLLLILMTRFGLLAAAASVVLNGLLTQFPFPADLSTWYAGSALFASAMVLGLAVYGFCTSLGTRAGGSGPWPAK